jgi:predicted DNA-binding WGR domain protein
MSHLEILTPAARSNHTSVMVLHALDAARNVRRRYAIYRSVDLFGDVIVEREWGRINSKGQRCRQVFPDDEKADHFIRQLLARRASSVCRIGVPYVPVSFA